MTQWRVLFYLEHIAKGRVETVQKQTIGNKKHEFQVPGLVQLMYLDTDQPMTVGPTLATRVSLDIETATSRLQ